MSDMVENPVHYSVGMPLGVEVIDVIEAQEKVGGRMSEAQEWDAATSNVRRRKQESTATGAKRGSAHYTAGMPDGLEPMDLIRAQGWAKHFALGNAQKYLSRAEHKGTFIQDINKAIDYLNEAKDAHNEAIETESPRITP